MFGANNVTARRSLNLLGFRAETVSADFGSPTAHSLR